MVSAPWQEWEGAGLPSIRKMRRFHSFPTSRLFHLNSFTDLALVLDETSSRGEVDDRLKVMHVYCAGSTSQGQLEVPIDSAYFNVLSNRHLEIQTWDTIV